MRVSSFVLRDFLAEAGETMVTDLRRRFTTHPGELGRDREEVFRRFLEAYLPRRFDVSNGFAFDASGAVSKQLDVIVAHQLAAPRFATRGDVRFHPCESVVAVGQLRTSVTSRAELLDAFDNLRSAKALDRSANGMAVSYDSGDVLDPRRNHLDQLFTFLVVTGDAVSGELAREVLLDHVHDCEPHLWPNAIVALDKYVLTYCCDNGVCPNPLDARGIALHVAKDSADVLMKFYLLLGGAIEVTRVSGLPYWEYLKKASQWQSDVLFAATNLDGEPPPFLSSLRVR
jgi:hypothetical protein